MNKTRDLYFAQNKWSHHLGKWWRQAFYFFLTFFPSPFCMSFCEFCAPIYFKSLRFTVLRFITNSNNIKNCNIHSVITTKCCCNDQHAACTLKFTFFCTGNYFSKHQQKKKNYIAAVLLYYHYIIKDYVSYVFHSETFLTIIIMWLTSKEIFLEGNNITGLHTGGWLGTARL